MLQVFKRGSNRLAFVSISSLAFLLGCGKSTSFSLLPDAQSFKQASATVNNKIDILWVVDNSGSMDPLQQNLVNNFSSFMTTFQAKGFDYKISVTTSDAYLADPNYDNNPAMAQFKDGHGNTHTGTFVITPNTVNPIQTFVTNATQGSLGSGDERVFQSLFQSLNSTLNAGFLRAGAFFAVIILSDEDDFSDSTRPEGSGADHDYSDPNLMPVSQVISQLDAMTSSTPANRHYNVSAITVLDSACQQQHYQQTTATIIGQRYIDLANQTNGVLGSVCDASYASTLNFIQQKIVELSTEFKLSDIPDPATIVVEVNGVLVAQDATNGWTYDSVNNAIVFHGTAVPPASANVSIAFDPTTLH